MGGVLSSIGLSFVGTGGLVAGAVAAWDGAGGDAAALGRLGALLGAPFFLVGLATGIAGAILLLNNWHSVASATAGPGTGDAAARTPTQVAFTSGTIEVPLLRFSF